MARSGIGRYNSRRDFLSGTDLAIAARHASLAELRADPAAQNTTFITTSGS
jgi:hypothetical protein